MRKRLLSLVMALAMICGFAAWVPEMDSVLNIYANAYSAHTRDEAINWVKSQVGRSLDYDGAYGAQCVDLILYYYNYLGVNTVGGNGSDYTWNALPSGWERLEGAQPQPGDILVYTGGYNNYGHVAIYESDRCHYHQNFNDRNFPHPGQVQRITYMYNGLSNPYWGVIRPDFSTHSHNYSSSVTNEPTCTTDGLRTYTCSCGDSYTESIPALDHDYVSNKVRVRMNYDGYTEYVCSRCGDSYKDNTVYKPELESDGWYHCAEVPEDIDTEKYEIQYNNYYEKIQSESPGDDWVNEGTHSDEWVNSGDPYKSLNELETSDSRVLLSYKYFHFCGPNAGASCNYEMAGNHVHYDEVSPSSVTVEKQGWDTDGNVPYFILNWNNGGGRVYCESGVTCDGSWGSHGRRGYAWYKESTYQDRIRVTKYKFTKSSGWTSSADPDATRTQIRFKTNHIHTYTSKVTKKATCTSNGVRTYTCSCGDSYTKTIKKLGHSYTTKVVKPTCTKKGYTLHKCARCGDNYKDTYKDATGHSWSKWTTTKKATCTTAGSKKRVCEDCGEIETATIKKLGHSYKVTVIKPTCTAKGYTLHKCSRCGDSYKDTYKNATAHKWSAWKTTKTATPVSTGTQTRTCSVCRKTQTKTMPKINLRLSGHNRYDTSISIADQFKKLNGNSKFKNVIIASGTGFADALSSAYLAKVKDAPILIVAPGVEDRIVNYVKANTLSTATIYIIGGDAAVPKTVDAKLKQSFKNVKRLWGKNRFGTNLAVLKEAGTGEDHIIIGNGLGYADALSASATGKPILLTSGKGLTTAQKAYLKKAGYKAATLIGESDVVSKGVESDVRKLVKNTDRQGGRTRFETSVLIAKKFFKNPKTVSLAYGLNYPDGLCGAPLSMKYGCPLILASDAVTGPVREYAKNNGVTSAVIYGGSDILSDKAVKTILGK